MHAVRALILDLDGTLLNDRAATRRALSALVDAHRPALPDRSDAEALARWQRIPATHWLRFEKGEITFSERRRARIRAFLGRALDDAECDAAFEPYREAYESSWSLVPEWLDFLCRTSALAKVIVTNGDRDQQLHKVRSTGLAPHILATITPADCGHWKPHPGIFAAALAALGVAPPSCLMIGDDPVRDIAPAQGLGMGTFLVEVGNPKCTLLAALAAD